MTEEQAVYDAVPDAVRVEDVVLTLAGQVDDLRRRMDGVANEQANARAFIDSTVSQLETMVEQFVDVGNAVSDRLAVIEHRLDKLQDANLAPLLESSALLVDLRRIADALEVLASTVHAEDQFKHQREIKVGGWKSLTFGGS